VKIVHSPSELEQRPRAVAIGSFDGVHRGHLAVIEAVRATGHESSVITFDPHPRIALGNKVELLTTLERRIELLEDAGVAAVVVASFTPELQHLTPEEFAERFLRASGVEVVVAGGDFRFGVRRSGDLALLERLGYDVVVVPELPGVSSTAVRAALGEGDMAEAAAMLGRPFELDGVVVAGDQRGGTLGYPTANLRLEPDLACPRYGIYAGFGLGHRAAISIGTNPHYGGTERRIEPYLLDFDGDLYGKRLVVELWERLRDEAVFGSEAELVEQIARDVQATQSARRPVSSRRSESA
jgi:riboflavin kinase / FMN adenylyltransferase